MAVTYARCMVNILRNCQTILQSGYTILHPLAVRENSYSSTSLPTLVIASFKKF